MFSFAFNITRFFELRTEKIFKNVTETVLITSETNGGNKDSLINSNQTLKTLGKYSMLLKFVPTQKIFKKGEF